MIKKILLGLGALVVVAILGLFIFVQIRWNKKFDDIPYPDLKTSTDSAVIARGKYLVRGPAHCAFCHGGTIENMFKADQGEEVPLKGGFTMHLGPLGYVVSRNLTPDKETGIGKYQDKEIFRMMRHVVKPDGTASVTPMMPFYNMADEDLVAIVSYLRSQPPVENAVPPAKFTLFGKFIRCVGTPFQPVYNPTPPPEAPPMAATKERGEYLARYVANCAGCHTPRDPKTFEKTGPDFSGGFEMEPEPDLNEYLGLPPNLWMRSPNITPDPDSYLSKFKTLDDFKLRFRTGRIIKQSPMPWGPFSKLSDEDIEALWIFLHTLEPVKHDVGPVIFAKE